MNHVGQVFEGSPRKIRKLLEKNGYEYFRTIEIDDIYVKKGLDFNRKNFHP